MAIDPVVIRFATAGIPEVSNAFATVASQAKKFEDQIASTSARGSRSRVTQAEREARDKIKADAKVAAEAKKAEETRTREQAREAKKREQASNRSARDAQKEALKIARETEREEERIEQRRLRMKIRSSEEQYRIAEKAVREETRVRERELGKWQSKGKGALSSVGGAIGGTARMVAGGAAMLGGFEMADAFRRQAADSRAAALLVNSATSNGVVAPGASVGNILGKASQVSRETGVNRGELIEGVQNYVALSGAQNFGAAMENMGFFAKVGNATGASMKDITGAAGILQAQNPNLSQGDMRQMLLDIMEQGKTGAVEIKDLASQAGTLGSTRGLYEGSVTENQRKLVALAQLTRTESTSAEEASIAVKDLGTEATSKAAKDTAPAWLKGAVNSKGVIKGGVEKLIETALLGTGGNLGELTHVFNQRGVKVFDRLAPIFNAAGGGEKGIAAVRKEMDAGGFNVRGSMASLDQQNEQVMGSSGKRLEVAMNSITTSMETAMGPALDSLSKKLGDPQVQANLEAFVSSIGKVVNYLVENPFKGLGMIVLGKVTADIAQAAIGSGVKAVLERVIAGAFNAMPGGMGGAGAVGTGGKVLGALGAGAIAATVTAALVEGDVEGQATEHRGRIGSLNQASNDAAEVRAKTRSGKMTPADVARLQAEASGLEKRQRELAAGPSFSILEGASAALGMVGQSDKVDEMIRIKRQENARELEQTTKQLNAVKAAAEGAANALKAMQKTAPSAVPAISSGAPAHSIGSSARSG